MSDTPDAPTVIVRIDTQAHLTKIATVPEGEGTSHALIADVDAAKGGGDEGPSPHDLLLASLGACIAITCKMYADRKKWPLEGVELGLRDHAPAERGGKERISVEIAFKGELSDDQLARLGEIAHKCPIHKAITAGVEVEMTPSKDA